MKTLTISLMLLTLFLVSACSPVEKSPEEEVPAELSGFVESGLLRERSPNINTVTVQAIAQDNTAFALSFYDQIREGEDNLIFSPLSLSLALSMTLAGAENSTEESMISALNFSLPEAEIYPALNALLLAIEESQESVDKYTDGEKFQLNIANTIWGQSGFNFKPSFLDILAVNFGAGVHHVDFQKAPEEARIAINDWVENETEGKIEDLIPTGAINPMTRLVLANAIYFNGSWMYPFEQTGTEQAPFTKLDGVEISVDMMKLFGEQLPYFQTETIQAVSLPYLSRDFQMMLIIPDEGTFSAYEDQLSSESILELSDALNTERVDLQLPKFDFESTINANTPLKAMGMAEAFDPDQSDFTSIADAQDLYITDVLHKATITVDEEGTEAAAATAVIVGVTSAMPEEPISLVIDRPFLFFIQHKPTGTILFMGRVTQP